MTLSDIRRRRWALVLLLAAAALAAALHGTRAAGATATASGARTVDVNHFAFHPPTLRISRGGRVAFANSSPVTHTATGAAFNTRGIKPGKTKVVQFSQKGTFAYHCQIHPFMKGKIVVE
jgi:plastocyanin